jgi:hypothetical protein
VIPKPARPRRATYCWVTQRGKIRYRTRKDAKAARSAAQRRSAEAEHLRIYKCPACAGFHLTALSTPPPGRQPAAGSQPSRSEGRTVPQPSRSEGRTVPQPSRSEGRTVPQQPALSEPAAAGPVLLHLAADRPSPPGPAPGHLAVSAPSAPGPVTQHLAAAGMPSVPTPLSIHRRR